MSLKPTLPLEHKGSVVHFLSRGWFLALRTLDRIAISDGNETIEVVLTQRRVADVSIERHVSPMLPSQILGGPVIAELGDANFVTSIIRQIDIGVSSVEVV